MYSRNLMLHRWTSLVPRPSLPAFQYCTQKKQRATLKSLEWAWDEAGRCVGGYMSTCIPTILNTSNVYFAKVVAKSVLYVHFLVTKLRHYNYIILLLQCYVVGKVCIELDNIIRPGLLVGKALHTCKYTRFYLC